MKLKNDLLLRTAKGESVDRTPVWLMRQAGRILPEYRAIRNALSGFKELVTTPDLAAEVTIQPVDILGVDAAIIFSDILVIPEVMGLPYEMVEKKGPYFPETIKSPSDIDRLQGTDVSKLQYVFDAIALTQQRLNGRVPLIGFAGAPWTLMAYMVEGGGSKTFSKARGMLYRHPRDAHRLLEKITQATIAYLKGQIASGAQIVQIFDSWAGILPQDHYREFSLTYIAAICEAIDEVPVTVFAKDAWHAIPEMAQLSCQVVGLDWSLDPQTVRQQIPQKTLQGNLDPCVLYGDEAVIREKTTLMLEQFKGHPHIANLGHGVYPDIDPAHVKIFIDAVKSFQSGSGSTQ